MEVQEICRKLRPIIGEKADRYMMAYLAEDHRGRKEFETVLQILAAQMLGSGVVEQEIHLSAPDQEVACGPYPIGEVLYSNRRLHPFGLREEEWIQHTAIFGRSGAGKTNTVFVIIEALLNKEKPFLIFDWKRNYRDLLAVKKEEILVYTVGRETVHFTFNPLIPPQGTDPAVWLKKLIEIIAHSYYLGEGVMFLLQEAIHAVYKESGVYDRTSASYPTFNDVYRWLLEHPVKGRKALWMDSTIRGIKSICFGHMGNVVNTGAQPNLAAILDKNVILELDGLTNADKTLIIESMLLWIHHYRLSQPDRETFKHAMIIEEAHHILLKRTGGRGGEAVTDTILREIRELGEAIILVDQHPSLISIPALGNTYTTIAMNLKHRSDISAVSAALLLKDEERELLGTLPVGSAVAKMQGRWLHPFLVQIPYRQIPKGMVNDEALSRLMTEKNPLQPDNNHTGDNKRGSSLDENETRILLSKKEETFLINVFREPLAGAVERYRCLCVSRRKGNSIRESLISKGLLVPVAIPTKTGRIVLTDLTDEGRRSLRRLGYEVPDRCRWGSLEHEYWKQKIAENLVARGWQVTFEEPVNGFTDIVARKDHRWIALEIETGNSDWQKNLTKNLEKGFEEIFIVATRGTALAEITGIIQEKFSNMDIRVFQAQDLVEQLSPPL